MSLSKLNYTKDWRNPYDFPTYSSDETQIRADMQLLFDEVCAALNKLIDDLDAAEIPFAPTPGIQASDVRQALIAIQNQIAQTAIGSMPDNSISSQKIMPGAITEEKMADSSVATRALEAKSVTEPKLGDGAVSTRSLGDGSVTREKMAEDAYDDKANLVNGIVVAEELTRTVKYLTATYTLVLDDLRKILSMSPTTAVDVTIPNNTSVAFPVGAEIDILSRSNNTITIKGASGVTVAGPVTKLSSVGDTAKLVKVGTNSWSISVSGKVTNEGLSDGSVSTAKISNGSVSTAKISDGAVSTGKIASGAVTRTKLANDALYSPLEQKTSSYTLGVDDIGKTILSDSSSQSDVRVITLNNANNNNFPIGTEIAIMAGNTGTTKLTVEAGIGVRGNKDGDVLSSDGVTVTIPRYCMIALKKFYPQYWLITGVFEVAS